MAGILIALAAPALSNFTVKMRVDNEIGDLNRTLLAARNHAVSTGQNVTVCALNSSSACTSDWHKELSVFIDNDNDKVYDVGDNDSIVLIKNPINDTDSLTNNKDREGLTYTPEGVFSSQADNSSFFYCPKGYDKYARGIIISQSGRTRKTQDTNNDGIDNDASGNNISCS